MLPPSRSDAASCAAATQRNTLIAAATALL